MGIITTYSCDKCGKELRSQHEYDMHTQEVDSNNLAVFHERMKKASTPKARRYQLFDKFLHSNPSHLRFDIDRINCLITSLRNGHISRDYDDPTVIEGVESTYWFADKEMADYVESHIDTIREEYNRRIQVQIDEKKEELERRVKYLEKSFV